MTPVLVDSNILIDIATDDPVWGGRGPQMLLLGPGRRRGWSSIR